MSVADLLSLARALRQSAEKAPPGTDKSAVSRYLNDPRVLQLNPDAREAVHDAVCAINANLPKLAVVAAWGIVIDSLHDVLWRDRFGTINQHLKNRRDFKHRDDIRDLHDYELIGVAREIGILNQGRQKLLMAMLGERNLAGHVGNGGLTVDFAVGFIERCLGQVTALGESSFPSP